MRVRRVYLLLAGAGLLLLLLDSAQRWLYIHRAPTIPSILAQGDQGSLTRAVMVGGLGMDEAETATCLRDLAAAAEALQGSVQDRLEVRSIVPGHPDYSTRAALEAISSSRCNHLVLYLSGHGGGRNFGAVGGLNITRDALAEAVSQAQFKTATVLIDCCWSGEFGRSFAGRDYSGQVTLVTSTDAKHPSPFPVSFLSPRSYGRMYFDRWNNEPEQAFQQTNQRRKSLNWLFSDDFGLEGQLSVF